MKILSKAHPLLNILASLLSEILTFYFVSCYQLIQPVRSSLVTYIHLVLHNNEHPMCYHHVLCGCHLSDVLFWHMFWWIIPNAINIEFTQTQQCTLRHGEQQWITFKDYKRIHNKNTSLTSWLWTILLNLWCAIFFYQDPNKNKHQLKGRKL